MIHNFVYVSEFRIDYKKKEFFFQNNRQQMHPKGRITKLYPKSEVNKENKRPQSKWNMDEICDLKFHLSYVGVPKELLNNFTAVANNRILVGSMFSVE